MKIIELTDEEFDLVVRSLGIAEIQLNKARNSYIQNVVNVRGVTDTNKCTCEYENMLDVENQICDLILSLQNGEKDYRIVSRI